MWADLLEIFDSIKFGLRIGKLILNSDSASDFALDSYNQIRNPYRISLCANPCGECFAPIRAQVNWKSELGVLSISKADDLRQF